MKKEIKAKTEALNKAGERIILLELRAKYMQSQKFLSIVENVINQAERRIYDSGFDAIIEMANENYDMSIEDNELRGFLHRMDQEDHDYDDE